VKIVVVSIIILLAAFGLSLVSNFYLSIFYFTIASGVFYLGVSSKSWVYMMLSFVLFARFCLENYQYDWSPIYILAAGHIALCGISTLLVMGSKNKILFYLPGLIFLQALSDLTLGTYNYAFYPHIHNALAVIQMSVFTVLVWEIRSTPATIDPIKNLIERLIMNMANAWPRLRKGLAD